MSHRVSTYPRFHSLDVCDWAHMPTVFVMITFFVPTLLLKYNTVPQPYLKRTGKATKN